jgi:hypothetical protein
MKINLRSGHWLNKGMDIELTQIDEGRSAAVSMVGVELVDNNNGGRVPKINYALRLLSDDYELSSRLLDTKSVEQWLADGAPLVRSAFEYLRKLDNVGGSFLGFAAEYERAYEYSEIQGRKKAIRSSRTL